MENQGTKKILIVDDDQKFVFALATFLVGHGYQVITAYDATFGMTYARKEDISLVILDIGLPGGGGYFLLENLRKLPKTICLPIIVSTGIIVEGVEEKVRQMGANDYIQKPYDLEDLLQKIRVLLH